MAAKIGSLARMARVFVRADIEPGSVVESAWPDTRDVIGNEVVAHLVAFVRGAPEIARRGMDRKADAVTQSGGKDASMSAVRVEGEDIRTIRLVAPTLHLGHAATPIA